MAQRIERDSAEVQFGNETADDPRVLALVKEYQAELDNGSRPDRARYLNRHPELAGLVAECLDGLELVHRGAKALTGSDVAGRLETGLKGGDRLGEFELVREVGRGGMGVVYEARQPALNRRVAVKVLPASLAADRKRLQRFTVEAQAAAAVAHPHIVPVYAVGESRGIHYYAMQLIDGSAFDSLIGGLRLLRDRSDDESAPACFAPADDEAVPGPGQLIDRARWDRPAYFRVVARIGSQVARALDHAHQSGVIHRDVKPANILLGRDGHVWVTDFGLAQFADNNSVTRSGATIGTLRYMSPEQASGDRRRLDHRTDVYSLAATLYELLVGVPAFPSEEPLVLLRQIAHDDPPAPRSVDPRVPTDLETVLLKAMQKEPRDRYATAAEFADDLDRFLEGRPVLARRPWAWDRAKKWAGRHPAAVAAALVSLLVVVAAGGIATAIVSAQHEETRRAYRAEQQRADEAERRFRQAKKLGDAVLRISEEEIGMDSPFQGPRRKLLLAALENYKDLLAAGHDDPAMHEELDRVLALVEKLLVEQAETREAEAAFLLSHRDVQAELHLSPDQIEQIDRAFPPRDTNATPPPRERGPGGPPRPGPPGMMGPDQHTRRELIRMLSTSQRQRLRQISVQLRGPMAFNDSEVVEALNLTRPQRQQIKMLHSELFAGFGPPPKGGGSKGGGSKGGGSKGGGSKGGGSKGGPGGFPWDPEAPAKITERILADVLTAEQRDAWKALIGKPFNPTRRGA